MLKPYVCKREYKIDNGWWTVLYASTALLEEDGSDYHPRFPKETIFTFDEVWESPHTFGDIIADHSDLSKQRTLQIRDLEHLSRVWFFGGKCAQISFKDSREEAPHTTLKYLMEHLPGDIVIRYLKDNGLTACPLR